MKSIKTILIFGASGSGSTTFARSISQKYGYHLIDTDDAIWEKSEPPFTIKKSEEESRSILSEQLETHPYNVICGSFVGWGDQFKHQIDLVVYMHLPLNVRLKRIQTREENRFHERVLPGGDLYLQHLDFLEWVSQYELLDETKRSQKQHEKWLKDLVVPIIYIKNELSIDELMNLISPYLSSL